MSHISNNVFFSNIHTNSTQSSSSTNDSTDRNETIKQTNAASQNIFAKTSSFDWSLRPLISPLPRNSQISSFQESSERAIFPQQIVRDTPSETALDSYSEFPPTSSSANDSIEQEQSRNLNSITSQIIFTETFSRPYKLREEKEKPSSEEPPVISKRPMTPREQGLRRQIEAGKEPTATADDKETGKIAKKKLKKLINERLRCREKEARTREELRQGVAENNPLAIETLKRKREYGKKWKKEHQEQIKECEKRRKARLNAEPQKPK
jgi:hypothetical protein